MRNHALLICTLVLLTGAASTSSAQVLYFEDFESVSAGWTAVGGGPLWQRGAPSQTNIHSALSGSFAWMTDLSANYPNLSDASVVSPVFDFSGCAFDPVLTFGINFDCEFGYDGMVVEVDRNDGGGFVPLGTYADPNWYNTQLDSGPFAFSGTTGGWINVSHALDGTAGNSNVTVRMRFLSDTSIGGEGVAIDDVLIICPQLSGLNSYRQGFEFGAAGWTASGTPLWAVGSPFQATLGYAFDGISAVMTDLAFDYPDLADASAESPVLDFSQCPTDPILEFWLIYETEPFYDGMRVEIDRNDGNGFVPLGSSADPMWYDGPLLAGGDGFTGSSGGTYRRAVRILDGTAGNPLVRIRMRFFSDGSNTDEGVAFDGLTIRCYCPGTETLVGEDITQIVAVNTSFPDEPTARAFPGDVVSLITSSPGGALENLELLVLAEAFPTGAPPASPFPGICVSGTTQTIIVLGGPQPPLGVIPVLSPFGFAWGFTVPPGLAGVSLLAQSFVLAPFPFTSNGVFASTDARIIQFE